MIILRNCWHYSDIQVGYELGSDRKPIQIIKTSYFEDGASFLRNEYEGIKWYCEQLHQDVQSIATLVTYKKSFAQLTVQYFNGKLGDVTKSLVTNKTKLRNAIVYYFNLFKNCDYQFHHGDYTLDNILFNEQEQVQWITDWESFNDRFPKGFDVINCVLENCIFYYKSNNGCLFEQDVHVIKDLLHFIATEINIPNDFFVNPMKALQQWTINNQEVFLSQSKKYPLINGMLNEKDISLIDAYFK